MLYIWYSTLMACLAVFFGLGLTSLVCPDALRRYAVILSPVIGFCYVTVVTWLFYSLDIGGTDAYARYLLVPPAAFLCIALAHPRHRRRFLDSFTQCFRDRGQLLAVVVAIVAFLRVSTPFLVSPHGPTTMSSGNLDSPVYALGSRVLKESSKSDEMGNISSYHGVRLLIGRTTFGAFVLPALNASLLSLKVHQIQSASYIVFFCFSLPVIYVLARRQFDYTCFGALLIVGAYAVNPIVYYTIYASFQSQLIAMTLSVAMVLVHLESAANCKRLAEYVAYLPFAVLLSCGINFTYPHMLPLTYGVIGFCVLCDGLYRRSPRLILDYGIFAFTAFAIMCLSSPYRAGQLLWSVWRMAGADAGWAIPFVSPAGIFLGFVAEFEPRTRGLLAASAAVLILAGLVKEYRRNRPLFIKASAMVVVVYAAYTVLYFSSQAAPVPVVGYKSYKLLSFFLPLIIPSILLCVRDIRIGQRSIAATALLVIIGVELFFSAYEIRQRPLRFVSKTMAASLPAVDRDPSIRSINIAGAERSEAEFYWPIMWSAYFLASKTLYFQRQSYYNASAPEAMAGEKTLLPYMETLDGPPTLVDTDPDIRVPTTITQALPETAFRAGIYLSAKLPALRHGTRQTLKVLVRNLGNTAWPANGATDGKYLVRLGNHWSTEQGTELIRDDGKTPLLYDLRPGEEMELLLIVTVPGTPGRYVLALDMVQEDVGWFAERGSAIKNLFVIVK